MGFTIQCEAEERGGELLAVYYRLQDAEVARTVPLSDNCSLDLSDTNSPVGLELVGPYSLKEIRKAASMFTSPALEHVFRYLGGTAQLAHA